MDDDGKTRDLPAPDPVQSLVAWGEGEVVDKPSTAAPPIQIGRCTLRRVIASGGMGTVYEAMQDEPRRIVALKVMRMGVTSLSALERFKRESELLARLRHPCIAQVYEAGMYHDGLGESPYFVMEFIPNAKPITEYVRERNLDVRRRLELFMPVCDAVHHGNSNGIVHRDLKPSNILVDAAGQVKIIDFGVARATDVDLAVTMQTDVGQLVGTLQYMSPEQAKADPFNVDVRSDVYSLGVVLYQLLTNRLPYEVKDRLVFDAVRTICEQPPTRLSSTNSHLRGDLETIIGKALAKDRELRYHSAEELRQDIQRYLRDEPIVARPPTFAYLLRTRGRAFAVRHPLVSTIAACGAALVASEFVGVPLVYHWTHGNEWYTRFVGQHFTPAAETGPYQHVRVVAIDDKTLAAMSSCHPDGANTPITRESVFALRSHHGELMTRLADSGVGVVAFDIVFGVEPDKADRPARLQASRDFAKGVKKLRARDIDVVVSGEPWAIGETLPDISADIFPDVEWGGITAGVMTLSGESCGVWPVDLVIKRESCLPAPSLSLGTAASFLNPGTDFWVEWPTEQVTIGIQYNRAISGNSRYRLSPGRTDWVRLTAVSSFIASKDPEAVKQQGLVEGDLIGHYEVTIPDDDGLARSTLKYEDVWTMSPEELKSAFTGKALLFGNTYPDRDIHRHPSGRMINGVYAHASAIESLIRFRQTVLVETQSWSWGLMGIMAILAAVVARLTSLALLLRTAAAAVIVAAFVLTCMFMYQTTRVLFNPMIPVLAFLLSGMAVLGLNRIRLSRST